MEYWLLPSNRQKFDLDGFLLKYGFVDWRQYNQFNVGDTVYMYSSRPDSRISYMMRVVKINMNFNEAVTDGKFWTSLSEYEKGKVHDKYCRLEVIDDINTDKLRLEFLLQKGLRKAPQGGMKLRGKLLEYIEEQLGPNVKEEFCELENKNLWEGAVKKVLVNRYERNPLARKLCINKYGYRCFICGFDFEKVYGELGRGFIHIHHIIPISTIGKDYIIDCEKDLIPVCPNCHAMLHYGKNGSMLSPNDLIEVLKRNRSVEHEDF